MPPLSSPISLLFVFDGPSSAVFYFHPFISIIFSFFFIFWPGGGKMKHPLPASLPSSRAVSGSFSSLRWAPASLFFLLCPGSCSSVFSAPSSAECPLLPLLPPPPQLSFPHLSCPFSPFFYLFISPSAILPIPTAAPPSLLWFPHCHHQ